MNYTRAFLNPIDNSKNVLFSIEKNEMEKIKNKFASVFFKAGIHADFLTVLGLLSAFFSAVLITKGMFFWAGAALLLSGFLDLMDGAVARLSKTVNPFGGILDSSLDRYGDGFVFAGLFFFCARRGSYWYALLAVSAWLGSFLISYVRARAECVIPKCRVGFWERGERIAYVALGLLFNNIALVLWVLAIATHGTALLRLAYSKKEAETPGYWERHKSAVTEFFFQPQGRSYGVYFFKITVLFLAVVLVRISL